MNFGLYDLLSQVVPGFVVYLSLLRAWGISWDKDYVVAATVMAYLAGYLINALGSWLEGIYFWTWGGKPSSQLLKGKGLKKVQFYHADEARQLLAKETDHKEPGEEELFSIAMRYATGIKDTRIEAFNANYAFSRNILTACLLAAFLLYKDYSYDMTYLILVVIATLIAWQRCKERGYYFAKEVLQVYMKLKKTL